MQNTSPGTGNRVYVPIPMDLNKVKTKVALNLTKRQLICFSLAGVTSIPVNFLTKDSPDKKEWGSGLLRYATDDMAVSFLKKAIELKRGTKDEKKAIEMYEFFCEENGIIPDTET